MALSFRKWVKGIFVQNEADRTKEVGLTVDNAASSGTSTTIVAKQTLSRTIDLPNTSGELVEKDFAQTLTNKTIDGDTNTLQDISLSSLKTILGDANEFIARDVSGQVISTNVVPSGTVVGTTDSQTLTNKTISGASNAITNIDADNVVVDPTGNLAATNAQAALVELQGDIDTLNSNKVTGPASATDNAIVRYDSTTGKLVQDSSVLISDTNSVTGVVDLTTTGNVIVGGNLTVNGTTTTVNTATLDVVDQNITVNFNGNDATAEGAGLTIDRTGTSGSLVYEDALASKFKAGALGSEIQLANISSTQSLTNKNLKSNTNLLTGAKSNSFERETGNAQVVTIPDVATPDTFLTQAFSQSVTNKDIDGGTASNTSRLTVPKNTLANLQALTRKEGTILYATDTDKFYRDDGTSLQEIGSGSGTRNFIPNGDAESGTIGWASYADAAASRPVDGTGGSPTGIGFIQTSSSPLDGLNSFLFSKDAANRQGSGFSYNFTIDSAFKAKVLNIEMDYLLSSGTFTAGSSTADSDLIVYMYDVTNSQLIEPSSFKLLSNSTTISDKFRGTFQTSATGTSYRLIFHVATTSASAFDLKIDNVKVSPSNYIYGTPISDMKSYVPTITGFGTVSNNTADWSRHGDKIRVVGRFTSGTSTAVAAKISLPSVSIDSTKIGSSQTRTFGIFTRAISATNTTLPATTVGPWVVIDSIGTDANSVFLSTVTNTGSPHYTATNGNNITNSGDSISYEFEVPIAGWSSSVQMSDQTDTRVVAANITGPTSGSLSTGAFTTIIYATLNQDTHGAYNTGTGVYTVRVSGFYTSEASIGIIGTGVAGASEGIRIQKNGTALSANLPRQGAANSGTAAYSTSVTAFYNIGDTINAQYYTDRTTATYSSGLVSPTFSVSRVSGPSAISANENINAGGFNTSGQSLTTGSQSTITGWSEDYDSHGAFNNSTGVFTCPTSGKFQAQLEVAIPSGYTANTGSLSAIIVQGGSAVRAIADTRAFGNNTDPHHAGCVYTFSCLAGDTLTFQFAHSNGTTRSLYSTDGNRVKFSVNKVGN